MSDQFPPYQPPSGSEPEPPGPVHGQTPPAGPPPPSPGVPYGQPYGAPGQPQPGQPYPAYGAPGQSPYGYAQSHQGATTSMILGIVAIVMALLNFFCCVTGVFSLALGPVAIWMGIKARREIDAQPSQYGNRGMAVAGVATGIIGTLLGALTFAVILFFFGAVFSAGY